jgi:hypothetical protein
MRGLVCNAEMVLMEAVLADPTVLPGFEHRTFSCSVCRDIERRLVFTGAKAPADAHREDQTEGGTVPGSAWGRAVERVLSRQKALNDRAGALKAPSERQHWRRSSAVETMPLGSDHQRRGPLIWLASSIAFGTIRFPQQTSRLNRPQPPCRNKLRALASPDVYSSDYFFPL